MDSYKKIVISGSMGSGKSTLSNILGKHFGIPSYKKDILYVPNILTKKERELEVIKMQEFLKLDTYIIDGFTQKLVNEFNVKYDLIIHLKLGLLRTLWQVLKRKNCSYEYNPLKIVYWALISRRRHNKFIKQYTSKIIHLTSNRKVKEFTFQLLDKKDNLYFNIEKL